MKQLILEMQDMAGGLRGRERGDIFSHLDIGLFKSIVKFLYKNDRPGDDGTLRSV